MLVHVAVRAGQVAAAGDFDDEDFCRNVRQRPGTGRNGRAEERFVRQLGDRVQESKELNELKSDDNAPP
jgi:hypothetical protein